jgi:hypothetical protein
MADNFNLRQFLTENKLTKNAKLLKEQVSLNGKPVNTRSIEIEGIDRNDYPDFVDAYITYAEYEDGTPLSDEELMSLEDENYGLTGELIHDSQLYLQEKKQMDVEEGLSEGGYDNSEEVGDVYEEAIRNVLGVNAKEEVVMKIYDKMHDAGIIKGTTTIDSAEQEVRSWIKANSSVMEAKQSPRENYLTRLVENALGIDDEEEDFINPGNTPEEDINRKNYLKTFGTPPTTVPGDEMANETVIPEYRTIDELMKSIDHGTNEVAEKHKMEQMKKIAQMLRDKAKKMEESEHAAHISPKDLKQLATDAAKLEKAAEKLKAAFDKKFNKKEKPASAPKAEKVEALQETTMENFDLKKFLAENKLTTNSRMVSENGTYTQKEILRGSMQGFKAPNPEELKVNMMIAPNMSYGDSQEQLNQEMGRITAISGDKVTYKKGDGKLYNANVDDIIIVAS